MDLALNQVVIINVGVTALLTGYVAFARKPVLGRGFGVLLVGVYAAYIVNSLMA